MKRIGMAVSVLLLFCPRGLLGWVTPLTTNRVLSGFNAARQDAGPEWLVRRGNDDAGDGPSLFRNGRTDYGYATMMSSNGIAEGGSGHATPATRTSAWKQAGIYGLEFGTAAVGSFISAMGAYKVAGAIYDEGDIWQVPAIAAGCGVYVLTSTFLSAAGTYFIGRLFGQGGSFGHALAGGAVGGAAGGGVLVAFEYSNGRTGVPSWPLLPIGLALPAAGAVTSYNVWK